MDANSNPFVSAILIGEVMSASGNREERVRVAVRVRPFNGRETSRGCSRVVDMEGPLTTMTNPKDPSDRKTFTFDHSFWSFDGFVTDPASGVFGPDPDHPRGSEYCGQDRIFEELGKPMLDDAFDGYNTTLFSYGQTGAGKSYSIMGYGTNEGIVPMMCNQIFQTIGERTAKSEELDVKQYEVYLSMLEIYNEVVYDLLNPPATTKGNARRGLKVREHPKRGFYAEGLQRFLVAGYPDIERLIRLGTLNRTVTSTNMNATSSRAHTIVSLSLVQKRFSREGELTTTSVVNIVDLAGSERVAKAGNTSGERFREGVSINQSLQCLGHCIHALAESGGGSAGSAASGGSSKPGNRIPYRDSVLTKLLMNALGGNSRTVMIASISPADSNYEETLSTLRYADRAKQIRTRATVNEDPTEKLVRDLKIENERLKSLLNRGIIDPQWLKANGRPTNPQSAKEMKRKWEVELKAQMAENERQIDNIRIPKKDKILMTRQLSTDVQPDIPSPDLESLSGPQLQNVNMDPMLTGQWKHYLNLGRNFIGKAASPPSGIEMIGPGMLEHHAEILVDAEKAILRPLEGEGRILVNGLPIQSETELRPNDRLVFGSTQLWLFRYPALEKVAGVSDSPMINYDFFMNEIASKSGLDGMFNSETTNSSAALQEELLYILPCVEEANGISAEFDKRTKFEIVLIAPQIFGFSTDDTTLSSKVYVKMKNLDTGADYLWTKDKFLGRFDLMKEMYRRYQMQLYGAEEEGLVPISNNNDPFSESPDAVVIIGVARLFLQPLAHLVEVRQSDLVICDLRGTPIGSMEVSALPYANEQKLPLPEDVLIENPEELIGRKIFFEFHLDSCRALPPKFRDIHCKFRLYGDKEETVTASLPYAPQIQFDHRRMFHFESVSKEFLDYLNHGSVVIEVLGRHLIQSRSSASSGIGMNSRQLLRADRRAFSRTAELMSSLQVMGNTAGPGLGNTYQKTELMTELQLIKQTHIRLQQRLDFIRQLVDRCMAVGHESIPTALLDAMLEVSTREQALRIVQQLQIEDTGPEWKEWDSDASRPNKDQKQSSALCSMM